MATPLCYRETYCCECEKKVQAGLVSGDVIYPHRPDLYHLKFWQCPHCKNYAGYVAERMPIIPDEYIRKKRRQLHDILDRLWTDREERKKVYQMMSKKLGCTYHTAWVRSKEDVDRALAAAYEISEGR